MFPTVDSAAGDDDDDDDERFVGFKGNIEHNLAESSVCRQ